MRKFDLWHCVCGNYKSFSRLSSTFLTTLIEYLLQSVFPLTPVTVSYTLCITKLQAMIQKTKTIRLGIALLSALCFSTFQDVYSQANQCPNCWQPVIRQKLHVNQSIPSSSIRGFTETLPPNYNPNGTQKYPLIINIHGQAAQGSGGSIGELCLPACEGATIKLEQYLFPETVVYNGVTYGFIVLTPQYNGGTTSNDIARFIDYALGRYKADPTRVYLTGLSLGSNVMMNYVTSSVTNARKVAAVVPLAGCSSGFDAGANTIATANVRYWGVHSWGDNVCGSGNTTSWATEINQARPGLATATLTPVYNPDFPHDIFSTVYNGLSWKTQPANPFQKNITEWMIQYSQGSQSSLPATLGDYTVSLKNKQVAVEWTTNLESETDYFVIERASGDMKFKQVSEKIKAAGNSSDPLKYSFTDLAPLKGTSFYRLVLINKDGLPDIFEIKKVVNREFGGSFSISPVPANKTLELAFELDEAQPVNFAIRDINGRMLKSWSANFTSGVASMPVNIESLKPGVYFFTIQGSKFTESKKFIKQ
jgi:hypothetical protein